MPFRDETATRGAPFLPLAGKELRDLLHGRAFWISLVIVVYLTGYSYIQALRLYSQASRSALEVPELARGLSPLDGILVPTLGTLYVAATFLFPFIVIRTVGAEKQAGAHKLLVQLPYSTPALLAAKLGAALAAWTAMLVPSLVALAMWRASGGHLHGAETANLLLGHFLYAFVVAGISLSAAALTRGPASAAILAVGVTLGFWALDLAAAGGNRLLRALAGLSLTPVLRTFERGVFSLGAAAGSLTAALGLVAAAGVWLHPGCSTGRRLRRLAIVLGAVLVASGAVSRVRFFRDATEDRRNSFPPACEALLRKMKEPLAVDVYLAPEDPRLYDLKRSILDKLRRTLPEVRIAFPRYSAGRVPTAGNDRYGEVIYRYAGRRAVSRSTSEEEVLPLIFQLAGLKRPVASQPAGTCPGYPLVAGTRWPRTWFYLVLPLLTLLLAGTALGLFRGRPGT